VSFFVDESMQTKFSQNLNSYLIHHRFIINYIERQNKKVNCKEDSDDV